MRYLSLLFVYSFTRLNALAQYELKFNSGHADNIVRIALTEDESYIASASSKTLMVRDVNLGREIWSSEIINKDDTEVILDLKFEGDYLILKHLLSVLKYDRQTGRLIDRIDGDYYSEFKPNRNEKIKDPNGESSWLYSNNYLAQFDISTQKLIKDIDLNS